MIAEAATEFFKLLGNFQPAWVLAIVVASIIAYRLPQLIREIFAGIRGLLLVKRRRQ